MCGIAGIYSKGSPPQSHELVPMVEAIRRRGPDDRGFFVRGPAGLGISRLAIVDPENGRQPLFSEDGQIAVVCNGEIYNHPDLKAELEAKGHRYKTRSDVETIAHLYEEEGLGFVRRLQGMFAIALWDERAHRFVLARDRLGIKPLYYGEGPHGLVFGSELKAVLASGRVETSIDPAAVDSYFRLGYIPNPQTIYREVRKLPPGHLLIAEGSAVRLERYWSLSFEPKPTKSIVTWTEEFHDLFKDTVNKHLMSDVPLGAFLSGGVDSSLVVAVMAGLMDAPAKTFTIGFGGRKGGYLDERDIAREVSRRYGTEHREFEVQPRPGEILEDLVAAFDEPFADDGIIPTYYLCREARREVKVALTGLGGDELFGGYERYLGIVVSGMFDRLPGFVNRKIVRPVIDRIPERRDGHYSVNHLKRFVRAVQYPPQDRYERFVSVFQADERRAIVPRAEPNGHHGIPEDYFGGRDSLLDGAIAQDIHTYLPEDILALSDRVSMWHSLELRVPFIDHKLVEFCCRMPASLKIRGTEKKYLLRKAAAPLLPPSVLNHRKQGFAAPMAAWLHEDLREFIGDTLSPEAIRRHGWLESGEVQSLLHEHWDRKELNDRKIFTVLMFQCWLDSTRAVGAAR